MPQDGCQWWHIIISTWKSWLPGDQRGFRSRGHKIHSSGDYKNPPPVDEHAGLRKFHQEKSGSPVIIPAYCRETAGRAMLAKLKKEGYRVLAISVAATHSHWLVELPESYEQAKLIAGQCKSQSSHAIRDNVPGRVWASGGDFNRIKDRQLQLNVYRYILDQENAWIWDFAKEEKPDEEKPTEENNEAPG